jgi:enoyl reductase-like protein
MDMVLFKIKRRKEMRYIKLLKNSFVFVIILCLTFVTLSQSASANEPTSNELEVLEDNLVNELELVGIEEADVNIMLPKETQSNKVEEEVESVYEDKLSAIIDKPIEEVDESDLKEVIQDVEAERIVDIKVEDVQEFEEVFCTNEEAGEDNELIEEMKEDLSIENENIVDENDIVIEVTGKDDLGESFTTALGFSIGDKCN